MKVFQLMIPEREAEVLCDAWGFVLAVLFGSTVTAMQALAKLADTSRMAAMDGLSGKLCNVLEELHGQPLVPPRA
jgi:hypothetical protein